MGCKLSVSVVHPAENFVKKILSPNKTKSKEIIEDEKTKNTAFSKKIEDINFEVLLARPPLGKYRHKTIDNFDEVDNQDRCTDLWAKWEEQYSWKDDNKDLID